MTAALSKAQIRTQARAARSRLSPHQREQFSAQICAKLTQLADLNQARIVAGFNPLPDEVDIRNFAINSIKSGRAYCVPRVVGKGQPLAMHKICGHPHELATGYGGIREPSLDLPQIPLAKIAVALVPSISVDHQGNRVGWGTGFYDITISAMGKVLVIAPIFSCQLAAVPIPTQVHDRRVDIIVTENHIFDLRK